MTELWTFENEIYDSGVEILCGVDEAGRGPLAGPVCAAAVILPRGLEIEGLNDSKKLSEKKRDKLFAVGQALACTDRRKPQFRNKHAKPLCRKGRR